MASKTDAKLSALLDDLLALDDESGWVEFKHNNADPVGIGEYISALANSATLEGQEMAYLVWGIEDGTRKVRGTTFKPRKAKGKGNEDLEPWLTRLLDPQVSFRFHEWEHRGRPVVLLQIPRATHRPVAFQGERYIRVGSYKKPLKGLPAKEQALWMLFAGTSFERGIARAGILADEVLSLIDFSGCFDLLKIPLPSNRAGILKRLAGEKVIVARPGGRYDVTNLGAVLFAKNLGDFDRIGRKSLRVIRYKGSGRTETEREWRDPPSQRGYALAFEPAIAFINSQLPHNEALGQAFRRDVPMYPEKAIRELVANALVHQDFSVTGAGPMVEIFPDRLEITNPGEPLVDTRRFIDTPPRSRNEDLAALMRRMNICEERGSGIDKVIETIEQFHLPAPSFTKPPGFTRATLFALRKLAEMDAEDRIRACYQHACLLFVSGLRMTNSSLRRRFEIKPENSAQASRIIQLAVKEGVIRLYDPAVRDRDRSYVPYWA